MMTQAGKEIIENFKKKGKFTLAGNREYWEEIYFEEGKIICAGGETHGNNEQYRDEISEEQALHKIKHYFYYHSRVFEKEASVKTDEEVLEYWKRWSYEG